MPVENQHGEVFLNLTEIGARWGMSVASVLRYHVNNGQLPTRRHGRAHLVKVQDLAVYEQKMRLDIQATIREHEKRLMRLRAPIPGLELRSIRVGADEP